MKNSTSEIIVKNQKTQQWIDYKNNHDPELKKKIITSYMNLVHYVIHKAGFNKNNISDQRDFFQFGIEGLNEAINRFDPGRGVKFQTYAIKRIHGKICDELRKLHLTKPENAQYSNLSLDGVIDTGEDFFQIYETISSDALTPQDVVEEKEKNRFISDALKKLSDKERKILKLYYVEELTFQKIGKELNVTLSRVSQLHSGIKKKLKKDLEKKFSNN